jgi:hypothetical protein
MTAAAAAERALFIIFLLSPNCECRYLIEPSHTAIFWANISEKPLLSLLGRGVIRRAQAKHAVILI